MTFNASQMNLSKDSLRYSSKNVQFRRHYFLIVLPNRIYLEIYRLFQENGIHSIGISQMPNIFATSYFLKKSIHLLKVKGNFFDLLRASRQILSTKLRSRTTASMIKLGRNSLWLEITHAMDMVLPCKHKGVLP